MARNTFEPLGNDPEEVATPLDGAPPGDDSSAGSINLSTFDAGRTRVPTQAIAEALAEGLAEPADPTPPTPEPEAEPPGGAPPDTEVEATAGGVARFLSWCVVGGFVLATAVFTVLALAREADRDRFWALTFGFGCVAVGLVVLQMIGASSGYGVLRPLIGSDRRFSTSLSQVGLWTVLAVTMFGYLLGRVVFEEVAFDTAIPGDTWDQYLILLGGPFAAAVLSKGIVTHKVQAGTLQKSEAAKPEPSQVISSDQGSTDLVDAQYLLFNVIAMGYVITQLASTNALPAIPSPLLALTSATAATYVGNKAAQGNRPSITSLSPMSVHAGGEVIVFGSNFDPADHRDLERRITITVSGIAERLYTTRSSDSRVVFRVPASATAGHQTVTITSSAGVDTPPVPLQVLARTPTLTGLRGADELPPGARVVFTGSHLGLDGERVAVAFGTLTAEGSVSAGGAAVSVTVPSRVSPGDDGSIEVTVSSASTGAATAHFGVATLRITSAGRASATSLLVGVSGTDGEPTFTVNGRAAAAAETASGWTVTLPDGVDPDAELRIAATDALGRASEAVDLPAVEPS